MPSSSSSSSSASSSSSPYSQNTLDYTLDHTRAHHPATPESSAELVISADTRDEAEEAMRACALQILQQPVELLRAGVIQDEELSCTSKSVAGSTVGKHLRHVLDHFRLFLDALEATEAHDSPFVDYDRRVRAAPIETSTAAALSEFEATQKRVLDLLVTEEVAQAPQAVQSSIRPIMERPVTLQATTPIIQEFKSTIGREVWFICLHSIHHFALARVILNELGVGERVPKDFGVAPSTLVYREWGRSSKKRAGSAKL